MVAHKEFSAWITVDGERLHEYKQTVDEHGRTAKCYIASEAGKNFIVNWFDLGSGTFTAAYIVCDGFLTAGRYINGYGHQCRSGVRTGQFSERPFQFADIPNTTSRNVSNAPKDNHVGTITLKIMHAQRGAGRAANKTQSLPSPISSEWAKKTGGHCVTFGKDEYQVPEQSPYTWSSKPLDEDYPHSHVKFVFKYRPLAWLQKRGIAPLGEQPKPEQTNMPLNFLPHEHLLPSFPIEVATSLSLAMKQRSDISTFVTRGMRRSSDQAKLDPIEGQSRPCKKQKTPAAILPVPPAPPTKTFIVPVASLQLYPPEIQEAARRERETKSRVASLSGCGPAGQLLQQQESLPGPSSRSLSHQLSYPQSDGSSIPSPTNSALTIYSSPNFNSSPNESSSDGPSPPSSLPSSGSTNGVISSGYIDTNDGNKNLAATAAPTTLILRKTSASGTKGSTNGARRRDKGKARATPAVPQPSTSSSFPPGINLDLGLGFPRSRGPAIGYGTQSIPHIPLTARSIMPPPPPKSRTVSATSVTSTSSLFSDPGGDDYFSSDGLVRMEKV